MKRLSLAVVFFLLLPIVYAQDFDDWIYSGDSFEYDGETYSVSYYGDKISFGTKSQRYILEKSECKETLEYRYCYVGADTEDDVKYEDGKAYPSVHLTISKAKASLSISRSFEKTKFAVGERCSVKVTVENTGDKTASGFLYEEVFPRNVKVVSASASKTSNGIAFTTRLLPGDKVTTDFLIEGVQEGRFSSKARYSYSINEEKIEEDTSSVALEITPAYDFNIELLPEYPKKDERFTYLLKISNTDKSNDIQFSSFNIFIPSGLEIIKVSGLEAKGRKLIYLGSVAASTEQVFEVVLVPEDDGEYNITFSSDFVLGGKQYDKKIITSFSLGIGSIVPVFKLSSTTLESESVLEYDISIMNKGKEYASSLIGKLSGDLIPSKEFTRNSLRPKDDYLIAHGTVVMPKVQTEKTYSFAVKGSYTENNISYDFSGTKAVTVTPSKERIEILFNSDPKNAAPGSTINIEVKLKNLGPDNIEEIDIADSVEKPIRVVEGDRYGSLKLDKGQTKTAYTYKLEIPDNFSRPSFTVETSLSADLGNLLYTLEKKNEIALTGTTFEDSPADDIISDDSKDHTLNDDKDIDDKEEENESGFFAILLDRIKSFFSSLF